MKPLADHPVKLHLSGMVMLNNAFFESASGPD